VIGPTRFPARWATEKGCQVRDDPMVVDLVQRAAGGDSAAWNGLVERYAPLVWSVCRRHRLTDADADDVGQNVWLLLVEHLSKIRQPAALPGWLATTTRRECLRVLRVRQHEYVEADTEPAVGGPAGADTSSVEEWLLAQERDAALRAAFAQLPAGCQRLLTLLLHDPPLSYAEISDRLGTKIGGLGPRRARCLEQLRSCPPLAALLGRAPDARQPGPGGGPGGPRSPGGTGDSGGGIRPAMRGER
jgi:RNA polymerase sigma factor (sigma-70 family)